MGTSPCRPWWMGVSSTRKVKNSSKIQSSLFAVIATRSRGTNRSETHTSFWLASLTLRPLPALTDSETHHRPRMEGLELGENYGHRSLHAGPSQSRTPNKGRSDEENTVDPRLTAEETAEEAKKRLKAEKKKRKLERAQKRALREAREARTALVDHEEPSGAVEDAPAEASTTKGKRKKRESLPADGQENDGRTKKRKSGTTKTRPSAPRQPSSDPENDPFTSSPIKLPPSSPPTFDDPNLDQEPESPVLLMKNRSKRTRKVEHQDDEETPARLLFPADHPALANGTSSSPEAAPSTAKEHPLATTSKQRTKATKPKPSANPTKSKPKSTAFQHSTPAGSTSQARRKPGRKPTKQTDEDLRKAFAKPSAMHEWLASKWVNLAELKRLEESGGDCLATRR